MEIKPIQDLLKERKIKYESYYFLYFLFRGEKIVFIGKGKGNPSTIVNNYKHKGKDFSHYTIIRYEDKDEMMEDELEYVVQHKPEYNRRLPHNRKYVTVSSVANLLGIGYLKIMKIIGELRIEIMQFNSVPYIKRDDVDKVQVPNEKVTEWDVIVKIMTMTGIVHFLSNVPEEQWTEHDIRLARRCAAVLPQLYAAISPEAINRAVNDGYISNTCASGMAMQQEEIAERLAKIKQKNQDQEKNTNEALVRSKEEREWEIPIPAE
jgi:hypothetical protein